MREPVDCAAVVHPARLSVRPTGVGGEIEFPRLLRRITDRLAYLFSRRSPRQPSSGALPTATGLLAEHLTDQGDCVFVGECALSM